MPPPVRYIADSHVKQQRAHDARSRGGSRPSFAIDVPSSNSERARGMPDAGRTHGPPAAKKQAAVTTGSAGTTGIPRATVLRLYRALLGAPGFLATVIRAKRSFV